MVCLTSDVLLAVAAAGARAYPDECCGVLLGRAGDAPGVPGARRVVRAVPLSNARAGGAAGGARRAFHVDAAEIWRAEREAEAAGDELVGVYHSHPDAPAHPSAADREHAWPWYSYLILSVSGGVPGDATAWRLSDDRRCFHEEAIRIEETEP